MFDQYFGLSVLILSFLGGLIAGYIIEKIIRTVIRRRAEKKGTQYLVSAAKRISGLLMLMLGILALYISDKFIMLDPRWVGYIDKTIFVLTGIVITIYTARLAAVLIHHYTSRKTAFIPSTSIFINISRLIIIIIGVLIILQTLGVSITPMLTALGVGGLAVALALQDTLANLFAGINILATGAVKIGDPVKIHEGYEGIVTDITWRYTKIQQGVNTIIIPNSKVANTILTNYSLPQQNVQIDTQLTLSFNTDLNRAEEIAKQTAEEVMNNFDGDGSEKPVVMFTGFSGEGVKMLITLKPTIYTKQGKLRHEFIKKLLERYNKEGIKLSASIKNIKE